MKTARKLALGGAEIRLQPRYNAFSGLDYPNHSTLHTHTHTILYYINKHLFYLNQRVMQT